jgi:drug/metabolite transporter (DMT)-like permease
MDTRIWKANLLLLLTAGIWGFAFVAQRMGMDYVGPFTYNGIRFALGSLSLIPLLWINRNTEPHTPSGNGGKTAWFSGILLGGTLFMGASLQQVGLVHTTAGNAGFITGLYVVIVPMMGLFVKQRTDGGTWAGAFLAVIGLYFLSITEKFTISYGDFLELAGAFFWAGHVLLVGWMTRKISPLWLSFMQFAVCSGLSLITACFIEKIALNALFLAAVPILYGGLCSVGIAYTLQVVAQKDSKASHAAIILSLESPIAAFGGWLILNEMLTARALLGCALMLVGMLVSQLHPFFFKSIRPQCETIS